LSVDLISLKQRRAVPPSKVKVCVIIYNNQNVIWVSGLITTKLAHTDQQPELSLTFNSPCYILGTSVTQVTLPMDDEVGPAFTQKGTRL